MMLPSLVGNAERAMGLSLSEIIRESEAKIFFDSFIYEIDIFCHYYFASGRVDSYFTFLLCLCQFTFSMAIKTFKSLERGREREIYV